MKKLLLILSLLFVMGIANVQAEELPEVTDKEKIDVYLFRGAGCGGCYYAIEEINKIINKYDDYMNITTFEIYNNTDNAGLYQYFVDEFEAENTIPFFVIGDSFAQNGYTEAVLDEVIRLYESDEEYTNIVEEYIGDNESLYSPTNLEEASEEEGIKYLGESDSEIEESNYDTLIIIGIFVVVIGGLAFLILSPGSKK